jgi:3-deoxy-D-arabino-heptulosonate 7-phosphate (DAHP) synthase class II
MNKVKIYAILGITAVVLIGGSIFLLTVGKVAGQFLFGRSFAESELRDYVSSVLKQEINGARCQSMDTDGNGYVSCDYTLASAPNNPQSIECSAWGLDGFLNRGCKTRFPKLR